MHLKMSFAICFNLDQSKNLLSGNELMHHYDAFMDQKKIHYFSKGGTMALCHAKKFWYGKKFQLVDL